MKTKNKFDRDEVYNIWIQNYSDELNNDELFLLKPDKIITMIEMKDPKVIAIYERYCMEEDDDTINFNRIQGKVNVSEEMGYINSVEEARELFENLYNQPQPDKES